MKSLPFSEAELRALMHTEPTPFYVYDEAGIRETARRMNAVFSWVPGYRNYFAVKALPNPAVLRVLAKEGMGMDCSSLGELMLAERIGLRGDDLFMTSNNTPAEEFTKAMALGATVNFDDITHLDYFREHVGAFPEQVCLRYNPGPQKEGNVIIGNPVDAKFGFTREQLMEGYVRLRDAGVKRFGLHAMVASNERDPEYFVETAQLLFDVAIELQKTHGITLSLINLGGGFGIPYRPEEAPFALEEAAEGIRKAYETRVAPHFPNGIRIVTECGRYVTGPHGYLVSTVRHVKQTYKTYIGLDACMANLMRPGMYGSYHHISILGKEDVPRVRCDVTGSLCENNDKFAIDRELPLPTPGDLVVIHDAGAHAHAMGFQYNAKLRSAEFLRKGPGQFKKIRRAETLDDYFATLLDV